jgi:diaminopimelate epimerase
MKFSKYHGTGNDFILINNMNGDVELSVADIQQLCHRRYGIGADGCILLNKSSNYDFEMVYYNSDGSSDAMCGNGGRCAVAFAHQLGIIKSSCCFSAYDGIHSASVLSVSNSEYLIKLSMKNCAFPVKLEDNLYFIDTGAPHLVCACSNIESQDVMALGTKFSNDNRLKERANVNFVEIQNKAIKVRTFERGVEAETLSCGTGVTASALTCAMFYDDIAIQNNTATTNSQCDANCNSFINIITRGGELRVYFERQEYSFEHVFLEGNATFVFSGETI